MRKFCMNRTRGLLQGFFGTSTIAIAMLGSLHAQAQTLSLTRGEATVLVEPYAPNIVRISLSLRKADALAPAGYGFSATPQTSGWTAEKSQTGDVLRSSQLIVTVSPDGGKRTPTGTQADIAKFFNGSTPGVGISIKKSDGTAVVQMQGWQMSVPNHKDGNADILYDRRESDPPFYQVGASFSAAPDEHDYFWTNECVHGGQSITVNAPIDIIPVFVKAGAILPLGSAVESTNETQTIASFRVYPGADSDFELYRDDGTTYDYEQGKFELTKLHWSEASHKLAKSGAAADGPVEIIGATR
jgi:hypothetical protein